MITSLEKTLFKRILPTTTSKSTFTSGMRIREFCEE